MMRVALVVLCLASCGVPAAHLSPAVPANKGVLLEDVTWVEAEKLLGSDTIVVIPIGAASKEHGPHLTLSNDWLLAEYFMREILKPDGGVIWPTGNYR